LTLPCSCLFIVKLLYSGMEPAGLRGPCWFFKFHVFFIGNIRNSSRWSPGSSFVSLEQ